MNISLNSRVALVTGAARGIGRATAGMLARHGATVVLTDLPADQSELEAAVAEIRRNGFQAYAVGADVRRQADVEACVSATLQFGGRLDILVNVAGVHLYPAPLLTIDEAAWDRVFDINLKGPLFLCQAAIPHMVKQGSGSVINIASDSAFDVIPDEGAYGISKLALVRFSAYLCKELSGTGVRVNSLAPGWVKTRLTEFVRQDTVATAAALEGIPARKFAEPEDIASVVLFLASELANYVNGHCIVVDGGRVAGQPA